MDDSSYEPMPVPWLSSPPSIIPIDVGRQLFVDDFLIAETTLERVFHQARKYENNPVLKTETSLETQGNQHRATPKDGGVWWDPEENIFKMWYEASWCGSHAYAVSEDGIHWKRPQLDINPPTNQILPNLTGDSGAVVLDFDAEDPSQHYKMLVREGNKAAGAKNAPGNSMVSADGIHWSEPVKTGRVGDRTTMFYNPFRKKWIYSIRGGGQGIGRARKYREHTDFLKGASWTDQEAVFWCGADHLDPPDPEIGDAAQLYNLNAVGYESLMLGLFEIHLGPNNKICGAEGRPKITELKTAFSRDGFHWHRPDRRTFIPASRVQGIWDRGYVQSVGGICIVMGDELWFYYTGFMGRPDGDVPDDRAATYANGSTGIAKLRRDGFASMRADENEGILLTRPTTFSDSYCFVNVDNPHGELRVELCDENGAVLPGYSKDDCLLIKENTTSTRVSWRERSEIDEYAGLPVRFRFYLRKGDLYSFWTSPKETGESGGYVAACGPGFTSNKDV